MGKFNNLVIKGKIEQMGDKHAVQATVSRKRDAQAASLAAAAAHSKMVKHTRGSEYTFAEPVEAPAHMGDTFAATVVVDGREEKTDTQDVFRILSWNLAQKTDKTAQKMNDSTTSAVQEVIQHSLADVVMFQEVTGSKFCDDVLKDAALEEWAAVRPGPEDRTVDSVMLYNEAKFTLAEKWVEADLSQKFQHPPLGVLLQPRSARPNEVWKPLAMFSVHLTFKDRKKRTEELDELKCLWGRVKTKWNSPYTIFGGDFNCTPEVSGPTWGSSSNLKPFFVDFIKSTTMVKTDNCMDNFVIKSLDKDTRALIVSAPRHDIQPVTYGDIGGAQTDHFPVILPLSVTRWGRDVQDAAASSSAAASAP